MKTRHRNLAILTAIVLGSSSCVQKMGKHGHIGPQSGTSSLRLVSGRNPEGTVAQTDALAATSPQGPVTKRLLARGREQYEISCMPCHGQSGYGDGMIVQRGFLAPPSYHTERLRSAPDSHFFEVITYGFGAMYSYADRVSEADRWAIIAYIRALQLSQNAKSSDLPFKDQENLKRVAAQ